MCGVLAGVLHGRSWASQILLVTAAMLPHHVAWPNSLLWPLAWHWQKGHGVCAIKASIWTANLSKQLMICSFSSLVAEICLVNLDMDVFCKAITVALEIVTYWASFWTFNGGNFRVDFGILFWLAAILTVKIKLLTDSLSAAIHLHFIINSYFIVLSLIIIPRGYVVK